MQHDIRELERQLADQAAAAQHEARHQAEQAAHTQVRFSNRSLSWLLLPCCAAMGSIDQSPPLLPVHVHLQLWVDAGMAAAGTVLSQRVL